MACRNHPEKQTEWGRNTRLCMSVLQRKAVDSMTNRLGSALFVVSLLVRAMRWVAFRLQQNWTTTTRAGRYAESYAATVTVDSAFFTITQVGFAPRRFI